MLKGQDILVLLKLAGSPKERSVRALAGALGLDVATVHRALDRLQQARLVDAKRRVNRSNAEEFLVHGLKYQFPVHQGGMTRGMPTAWAAPPLDAEVARVDEPSPVWPDPAGAVRGLAVMPLHDKAPAAAGNDPVLAGQLALIDAIRLGDGRVRSLASKMLAKTLKAKSG
jgi:DNA-binding transcriptional MocR family regulator